MRVEEIMNVSVMTISSDKSLAYVAERMNEHRVGSFLVIDHGITVGIITSLDVRSAHPNRIVADAMSTELITVPRTCFIWDAIQLMDTHRIERLVVKDGSEVCGMVTREALKSALSQLIDPLTGLYRQAYIHAVAEHFIENKQAFQVLFIDLDRFGDINKQYGHPVGDDLLVYYARRLKETSEETDYLCRYAGDEFVVVSLRDEERALLLAENLSEEIRIGHITVSASVGVFLGSKDREKLFSLSFREMITRASLFSTEIKKRCSLDSANRKTVFEI